ncbi:hypothetical protein JTB14_008697 [Gonioctena quinquepunctata]|nr:hypothetical protein JTB14_008697 [Gonioctena quinquepunctata]
MWLKVQLVLPISMKATEIHHHVQKYHKLQLQLVKKNLRNLRRKTFQDQKQKTMKMNQSQKKDLPPETSGKLDIHGCRTRMVLIAVSVKSPLLGDFLV